MNLVITRDKPIKNNLTYVGEPPHFSGMLMLKSAPQINCPASDASSANPAAFEDLQGLRSCKAAKVDANYDGNGMKWHDHAWSMESMAIWCVEMSGKFIYIWEYHLNIEPIISIITIRKNFTKAYGHIICGNLYVIWKWQKKIEDLFARRTRSPSQRGRPRHQKRRVFSDEKWWNNVLNHQIPPTIVIFSGI